MKLIIISSLTLVFFLTAVGNASTQTICSDAPLDQGGKIADLTKRCGYIAKDGQPVECKLETTICTNNANNTCNYNICLFKLGQDGCGNPLAQFPNLCEGGSVCENNTCVISQGEFPQLGSRTTDIKGTIRRFINIALGFLGITVVIFIVYGGALWLTAAGDDDKVSKGRHTLLWAALGAIIISIAWTISSYILTVGDTIG